MNVSVLEVDDPAWIRLLGGIPHDVYHLPEYLQAEDCFRGTESRLSLIEDSGGRSLLVPLSLHPIPNADALYDASSPYGYPAPVASAGTDSEWRQEAFSALLAALRARGVVSLFLRFHPLLGVDPRELEDFGVIAAQGTTVSIELGRPIEDIRSGMRSGTRYDIRRALREGQVSQWDANWRHFEDFLDIYGETMDRLDATDGYRFSRAYFEQLRDMRDSPVHLWVTKIDNTVAAASLITECSGVVQYHLSGTRGEYLRSHPTKVLLDGVAQWANGRGNRRFHLGGGLGGQQDSLFQFKSGFGKDRHTFYTGRIVVNQREFDELVARSAAELGSVPGADSDFFPPYQQL